MPKVTWQDDQDFEEVTLESVRLAAGSYDVKRADGWIFWFDDPGFPVVAGDVARFYPGGIGRSVRGLVINGRVVFYRTKQEDEQHHKDLTYPRTAAEALAKWDRGESLFTVEMGGLGPGCEQAIHVLVFELLRDAQQIGGEFSTFNTVADKTVERVSREGVDLGFSGAQVGAAKSLAFKALRDGWQAMVLAAPDDRHIQVSRSWPRIEPSRLPAPE